MLRGPEETPLWDVFASLQPSGWRPTAVSLRLLLGRTALQPGLRHALLQLAFQLQPAAGLSGPAGVLAALM